MNSHDTAVMDTHETHKATFKFRRPGASGGSWVSIMWYQMEHHGAVVRQEIPTNYEQYHESHEYHESHPPGLPAQTISRTVVRYGQ